MKLLIITQKVAKNDPILGFFHRWLEEFAKNFEKVTVICLEKGEYNLPDNVRILSLGKEEGSSRFKYVSRFYKYIWNERKNYDAVFVHMNPIYIVLGGLFWRIWRKKISLWYVHRQVNLKLKIAEKLANKIFTSSPESFRLKSKKVNYLGHGIDAVSFEVPKAVFTGKIVVLYVGRISKIKNIDVIIEAFSVVSTKFDIHLRIVGGSITDQDYEYKKILKEKIHVLGLDNKVEWMGSIPNTEMLPQYLSSSFSINASPNGGMDKVVLESLVAKRPVFVSNLAFKSVYQDLWSKFGFESGKPELLIEKIISFLEESEDEKENSINKLEKRVREEYNIDNIINKISQLLDND